MECQLYAMPELHNHVRQADFTGLIYSTTRSSCLSSIRRSLKTAYDGVTSKVEILESIFMVDEPLLEVDGVPTWLEMPVTEVPSTSPPVQSRPQVLPLNELSWEHFERLCLRYVRSRASVVMTQLYGVRGQKQHGIDLYVRLTEPARYEVYQCKRLATFDASDVEKAVTKFLEGKWRDKAKAFKIMTAHPIEDTKIADAIIAAQAQLSKHDIEFEVLGKEQISTWLKDQPRIVDDF